MFKFIISLTFCLIFIPTPFLLASDSLVAQDEAFFKADDIKKVQAQVAEKDALIGRMVLNSAGVKEELEQVKKERDLLQAKVFALQRSLVDRDKSEPQQIDQAVAPYRSRVEELEKEAGIFQFTIEQKNAKLTELNNARTALTADVERINGEKLAMRAELQKVADELDGIKGKTARSSQEAQAVCDEKTNDLRSRLTAEQTLTQEKIKQALKPVQDKLTALESQVAADKGKASQDILQIKAQLKQKDDLLAVLTREKSDTAVTLRSLEAEKAALTEQVARLKKGK
ncbi:MAG: hypothetical protein HQL22_11335 [Candidatus Omnitrophica bacterium]|nr:hypothetical protein [Candidatus Omnitrophota bacterium]